MKILLKGDNKFRQKYKKYTTDNRKYFKKSTDTFFLIVAENELNKFEYPE